MHREGVNVSTNAMWSTCVREFPTHTGHSQQMSFPVSYPELGWGWNQPFSLQDFGLSLYSITMPPLCGPSGQPPCDQ